MRQMMNSGTVEPLYLVYRPSVADETGELFLVRDGAPNVYNYPRVTGEALRGDIPFDAYFTWIYERAKRAPVLSTAK